MFSISRFAEVIQPLPRAAFDKIVHKLQGDRYAKSFSTWDHLIAMLFAQLSGVKSLREVATGFNQHRNHHYHLGTSEVSRSTLSGANARRDPQIFAELGQLLLQQVGRTARKERKEMLYLLDSTSIALRGRGSEWTKASATRTPGLKMHVLLAHEQHLPVHQTITAANVNDVEEGRKLPIERGAIYVFDKGYCDYAWWSRIAANKARFVTRFKKNAAVVVERTREVPSKYTDILSDEVVSFAHRSNRGRHRNPYQGCLRRIKVARPGHESLVLVTNDLKASAAKIAELYRQRWQIELFFKWIKQHLKIKSFLGENENAVRIQLLTALIAYLLVILQKQSRGAEGAKATLKTTLDEIRTGLFRRPRLEESRWHREKRERERIEAVQPGLFK